MQNEFYSYFAVNTAFAADTAIKPPRIHVLRAQNLLRVVMVCTTGVVVMAVPNFANLMALIGATCCSLLAFILPGVFHVKLFKGSVTWLSLLIDFYVSFGNHSLPVPNACPPHLFPIYLIVQLKGTVNISTYID